MSRRWIGVLGMLAAMSLAGCASDWQERYEQSQRENLDLVQQMEQVRSSQAEAAAKAESATGQIDALKREQEKLIQERNEAARVAENWKAEAEKRPTTTPTAVAPNPTDDVSSKVAAIKRDNPNSIVTVTPDGNIEITLPSDVTFASGSDSITDGAKKSLRGLSSKLNGDFGPYMIRVEGHTDAEPLKRTVGKYTDNLGLGAARANSVTRFMRDEMQIDAKRLMSASRGEQEPVADNKSLAGRAKNRRVEIVVVIPRDAASAMAR